ncbi:hypothetical protein L1787_16435 [Acuticoccus sp. M5D2P5]|uniref:phage late control D family protein n=1 Tax=Acuticoccus kalidii TaxID=2910977 RepID=UPI001F1D20C7|nr:contractile injection system protein, VgrG/Pvc8 family [Acuticoccus kalidii]MCF3934993.1 hypothetical protein [Acuticoccus kalidii]
MALKPRFKVTANGTDITGTLAELNAEITVIDAAGLESDSVQFIVDDKGGRVAFPSTGAKLAVWLGYDQPTIFMGMYTADTVKLEGWPQRVIVTGRAADQTSALKQRQTKEYIEKTLGQIFEEIAGRNSLSAKVDESIASILVPYHAQQEESDQQYVTRLRDEFDLSVTIKNDVMIVIPKGKGGLGPFVVAPAPFGNLVSYSCEFGERAKHDKVEATWFDRQKSQLEIVEAPVPHSEIGVSGTAAPTFRIRKPYPTKELAEHAARSKAASLGRDEASATFEINGDANVRAEMDVIAMGIRSMVDGNWVSDNVEHRWGTDAARTTITCKPKT